MSDDRAMLVEVATGLFRDRCTPGDVVAAEASGWSDRLWSALVKEVGTRFEQDLVEALRVAAETELDQESGSLFGELLAEAVLTSPKYTLQGGTTEILRSVAAKGLGK